MVSNFQWKLMIAGTVGGACALFSSILVFAILVCRHKRKLKRQAAERLKRQRLSAQWSTPSAEPSDLIRGDHVIGRADLPELPHHLDGNYIRPTWGVRPFWMDQGQHSLNHDSGYADLESNRTDSALFLQRSFSPLPRPTNGHVHKALPADVFPAMNHFDIDSGWSRSFDLLSPGRPHPHPFFDLTQQPTANSSKQHVTLPPIPPSGEEAWKSRISCRSDHQIRSSFQEQPQRPDHGLQLVEIPHVAVGNQSRSQFAGCRASVPSSSEEDSEPIWIRRTNANQDGTLTQSMIDCNRLGGSPSWGAAPRGNQLMVPNRPARDFNVPHQAASENVGHYHQKFSASGYKDAAAAAAKKHNGYSNPWETNGIVEHVVCNGRTNSNRLSSR